MLQLINFSGLIYPNLTLVWFFRNIYLIRCLGFCCSVEQLAYDPDLLAVGSVMLCRCKLALIKVIMSRFYVSSPF